MAPDNRARLAAHLAVVMPVLDDEVERRLRLRLLAARQIAGDELGRALHHTDTELSLFRAAHDVAAGTCFARIGVDHLRLAADTARSIICSASSVWTLTAGGANAR